MNTDYKNGSRPTHDKEYEFFLLNWILFWDTTKQKNHKNRNSKMKSHRM